MSNYKISDFRDFFESVFADIRQQASWDASGAQIYLGDNYVKKVCIALDPSEEAVEQAVKRGCELLITHHPLFFTPLKNLNAERAKDRIIIQAVQNNLSILSYHTNLDVAPYGINRFLIDRLGAEYEGLLSVEGEAEYYKLVIFTPESHAEEVLSAVYKAGAGRMGNYTDCSFSSKGTGTFTPLEGSAPFIGESNSPEKVEEVRQELLVPSGAVNKVVSAIIKAHPYETPAFDIIPVKSFEQYGFGCIGRLKENHSVSSFVDFMKSEMKLDIVKINFDPDVDFTKFAIVSGSGASMWRNCASKGIKVLVTGDMKHHDALDAKENGVCILDIGHYESERVYMEYLAEVVKKKFDTEVELLDEKPSIIYK